MSAADDRRGLKSPSEILAIDGHEVLGLESRTRCCFPTPATRSSISSATTSPSRTARCAGRRTAQRARALSERHRRRVLLSEARADVAARLDRGRRAEVSRRAARPKKSCRATRRRSPGWPTSPASSCIRIRCAPTISIIPTSCASISIRCRACEWPQVREVARVVRATLDDLGLVGWPKTSGSRGIHVNVRIERAWTFDQVRRAALALAREVERRAPALATSKWWKEERHGVFLDYNQNAKDRTVAAAYSVRPDARRARVGAARLGRDRRRAIPATSRSHTMPARFDAARRSARRHRRASLLARRAARALGTAGEGGAGRRALAAALPEAAGRAAARAAVTRRRPQRREARRRRQVPSIRSSQIPPGGSSRRCAGRSRRWTEQHPEVAAHWSQPTSSSDAMLRSILVPGTRVRGES